ncbi:peptidase s41 family protein [Colletotrichum karsti]|uniref:Peptidase s41 family protein n=1 Tax=Colletotrichum karsti TaxID=1095194 RepID=A0A9P6I7X8_9PEZI|nr:peptidase s41 family protein [Colletotrichum karsti]KAF9877894.1 peptidase s41 family protein [Colletotrichum karsti]
MVHLASALTRILPLAAGLAVAAPNPVRRQTARSDACAEIATAYDLAQANDSIAEVKPSLAYECLRSVPVDVERDVALLKYLRPWLEFQSTIGILPSPPEGYLYPGVDIFGGLDNITRGLETGEYEAQMDFAVDLYRLINVKPREGHLAYVPRLGSLIQFRTPETFISISEDGVKMPKVYLYSDYLRSVEQGYAPSEVTRFDEANITDHLQQRSVDNSRDQDPDAAYNEQLYTAALKNVGELPGAGLYTHTTLPDASVLEFANGTKKTVSNSAFVVANFSGIASGDDVHARFEVPGPDGEAEVPVNATQTPFAPALEGYPEPFVVHRDRYLSGYLFDDDEDAALGDTAVLAVNSFVSQNQTRTASSALFVNYDPVEFLRVTTQFVEACRRRGKTRLVIDLQGNGGGLVANAVRLYAALFPRAAAAEGTMHMNLRLRAHPLLDWVGSTAEGLGADLSVLPYPVGFNGFVDEDLRNLTSWADFYGPRKLGDEGQEFTNVVQPLEVAPGGFDLPRPWFEPEDTVIVTDGHCASACAWVVGMMTRELGVQAVAMGGRPLPAPMQAVGGTKGGPVIALGPYQSVYPVLGALARPPPGDVDVTPFADDVPPLAGPPTSSWVVNSANVYLDDDLEGAPVQFRYEAANCKLFYTWETVTDLRRLWEAVAGVKWRGGRCVEGSTAGGEGGGMGEEAPGFSEEVVSGFGWAAGPGDVVQGGSGGGSGGGNDGGGSGDGESSGGEDENAAGSIGAGWTMLVVMVATVLVFI